MYNGYFQVHIVEFVLLLLFLLFFPLTPPPSPSCLLLTLSSFLLCTAFLCMEGDSSFSLVTSLSAARKDNCWYLGWCDPSLALPIPQTLIPEKDLEAVPGQLFTKPTSLFSWAHNRWNSHPPLPWEGHGTESGWWKVVRCERLHMFHDPSVIIFFPHSLDEWIGLQGPGREDSHKIKGIWVPEWPHGMKQELQMHFYLLNHPIWELSLQILRLLIYKLNNRFEMVEGPANLKTDQLKV